jgi:hypothetical protein
MNIFIILFFYINIIISLAYCEVQHPNYYKIVLKNNGYFDASKVSIDENEFNNKDDKTFSIVNDQTLTIYQKIDDKQDCSFSYVNDANATIDDCRNRKTNKDNICCLLNITAINKSNTDDNNSDNTNDNNFSDNSDINTDYYSDISDNNSDYFSDISDNNSYNTEKKTWKRCVQVNKYEIKRFRGIPRVIYDKINIKEFDKGMIQCSSNYYKINELIIFGLLFMFLNF